MTDFNVGKQGEQKDRPQIIIEQCTRTLDRMPTQQRADGLAIRHVEINLVVARWSQFGSSQPIASNSDACPWRTGSVDYSRVVSRVHEDRADQVDGANA